jgi:cell fate (sporulation/competence/biofilm development) regulator YmcA (YheA/YmcA/DUF963 family)
LKEESEEMKMIVQRIKIYRKAAVEAKQANDLEAAKNYMAAYKQLQQMEEQLQYGQPIGM